MAGTLHCQLLPLSSEGQMVVGADCTNGFPCFGGFIMQTLGTSLSVCQVARATREPESAVNFVRK